MKLQDSMHPLGVVFLSYLQVFQCKIFVWIGEHLFSLISLTSLISLDCLCVYSPSSSFLLLSLLCFIVSWAFGYFHYMNENLKKCSIFSACLFRFLKLHFMSLKRKIFLEAYLFHYNWKKVYSSVQANSKINSEILEEACVWLLTSHQSYNSHLQNLPTLTPIQWSLIQDLFLTGNTTFLWYNEMRLMFKVQKRLQSVKTIKN